jgi:hypothetical protein
MLRALRIGVLLLVLATVAQWAWLDRQRVVEWKETLRVVVYPVDGDGSPQTGAYLQSLDAAAFRPIDAYMAAQAKEYGLKLASPVEMRLGPRVAALPPPPPAPGAGMFASIGWSLRMRWWAARNDRYDGPKPHVRMFVLYHDPARTPRLGHSIGLAKGMIGVVRAFASAGQQSANNVVIAHELLHTFGATDKYDPSTNMPAFPDGYAEPHASPRLPQRYAEIMAGRIPRSSSEAAIPASLDDTMIGARTAAEIHWLR